MRANRPSPTRYPQFPLPSRVLDRKTLSAVFSDMPDFPTLRSSLLFLVFAATLQAQPIVIQTSTMLDGKGAVIHNAALTIQGPQIRELRQDAPQADYDLRGLTVMPGWIDTHVHIG